MSDPTALLRQRSVRGTVRGADLVLASAKSTATSGRRLGALFGRQPWLTAATSFAVVAGVGILVGVLVSNTAPTSTFPMPTAASGSQCLEPPFGEATGPPADTAVAMSVVPTEVAVGESVSLNLQVGPGEPVDTLAEVGPITFWECWTGAEWEPVFNLVKGFGDTEMAVRPWNYRENDTGEWTPLPLDALLLVPEVGPGTYRLSDYVLLRPGRASYVWAVVTVAEGSRPPTSTVPPQQTTPEGETCSTPPVEEVSRPFTHNLATASVQPARVIVGTRVDLHISETQTAVDADVMIYIPHAGYWQCWNGSRWVDMYMVTKWAEVLPLGTTIEYDGVYRANIGELLIPDVRPGVYRVIERLVHPSGEELEVWAMLEVVEDRPFTECPTELRGSEVNVDEALFPIRLGTTPVAPGLTVELSIEPPTVGGGEYVTDGSLVWQCWNGTEWVDTHLLHKGWQTSSDTLQMPSITGPHEGWHVTTYGLSVPQNPDILIPDVPPGTYRIIARLWGPPTDSDPEGIIRSSTLVEVAPPN